jgi:transposase-like protein
MASPLELKARARTLYVEGGMGYEEVAQELHVPLSQLRKWGKDAEWCAARAEYERSFLELHSNVQKVKLELSKKAVETKDPQLINALSNLLRATAPRMNRRQHDKASLFLEFAGQFVAYLKERDADALAHLEPHLRGFAESVKQSSQPSAISRQPDNKNLAAGD